MRRLSRVRSAIAAGLAAATFAAAIAPVTARADYAGYRDLSASHWAVKSGVIDWAERTGAVDGYGDTWGPDRPVDRGTAAEILYKLAGRPRVSSGTTFADADELGWAANAAAWACETGIFKGYGNPDGSVTFDPWSPLTREQAAKVLRVVAQSRSVNPSVLSGYADKSSVSSWASGSVAWAVDSGVMGNGGSLNGTGTCSRVEFVAMLKSTDDRVHFDDDYWEGDFHDRDDDWDDDDRWAQAWDDDRFGDDWDDDDRFDDDDGWDDDRDDDDWDDDNDDDRFDDDDDRFDDDDDDWDDDRFDDDWDDDRDDDDDWDDDRDDDDDDRWDD